MQRLCYVSQATFKLPEQLQCLTDILTEARDFNARHHVQGVLYFADGYFLQCLEGESQAIELVLQRLTRDPRHQDLRIIATDMVEQAIFKHWSMKFVARHNQVKQFFQQHGYAQFYPHLLNPNQLNQLLHLLYQLEAPDLVA